MRVVTGFVDPSGYDMWMNQIPPGWYQDNFDADLLRWWDGAQWTAYTQSHPRLFAPSPQAAPASHPAEPEAEAKIGFFSGKKKAQEFLEELNGLKGWIKENNLQDPIRALEAERSARERAQAVELESQERRHQIDAELQGAAQELNRTRAEIAVVQAQLVDVRSESELQGLGLFDFEHPAEDSVDLKAQLESVKAQYKEMARAGQAVRAASGFTFNNSTAQGGRFVKNMSKILLRAYNAEVENSVKSARAGNVESCIKRVETAKRQIEKSGEMIDLTVGSSYHRLRLEEIRLASRHLVAVQLEKAREKELRAELREQKKAEAELAEAMQSLLKDQSHFRNAIEKLEARGDVGGVQRMREELAAVERSIEDVEFRKMHSRAGYVYVISNIGAFGPGVVKIGMTRRLDPMDRVNELGDASVPFKFDVHALFFSKDAVGIESSLHRRFSRERLNKVNTRREFFAVTPQDVLDALREESVELLEFKVEPGAEEHRQSLMLTDSSVGSID